MGKQTTVFEFSNFGHCQKTKLYNKIEDDFLMDSLILYIEREIAMKFIK